MRTKFVIFFLMVSFLFITDISAAEVSSESFVIHKKMAESSMFRNLKWENIGPYFQGGRIVDIEAYEKNEFRFLVATASGGLWLTENNGTTWEPVFDGESSISIGDIAISQTDEKLIWVGTGEANSSRSSYSGTGIFKSSDGGKRWKNMGLGDSHHISRIVIDPDDNNTVYVAVLGHLYTDNEERGVFKTLNGGKTWTKILYINEKTGFIDLVMDPKDHNTLYAASWEKERKAWNLVESGEGSGVYKTVDGGKTWTKKIKGLPVGKNMGRIGLAVSEKDHNILYLILDNQKLRPENKKEKKNKGSGITVGMLMKMSSADFLKIEDKKLEEFLTENRAPQSITVVMVKNMVRSGELNPQIIAKMLTDANSRLLNSNVLGAEVYRSNNGGDSWEKTHEKPLTKWMYSTYGYYFGQIRISPENSDVIYILGVPLLKSTDGGKTFKDISTQGGIYGENGVHADMHAMWIDGKNPRRVFLGNDGGLNISYDAGETWKKINNLPLAQCYTVDLDMESPFNIYSGLQDNGVVKGPVNFRVGDRVNIWRRILGGDGAFVSPEPGNSNTVYAEYQFGNLFRLNLKKQKMTKIQPVSKDKRSPYRFNWLTPFKISDFNPYILYLGANKVLKSIDRGKNWVEISKDLTDKKHLNGDVPYATIVALDESPMDSEILYAGTDDGNLWVTKNGGSSWESIKEGLPKKWVSRIVASKYKKGRAYVTLTGYRDDDFKTYVYSSENYGKSWKSIVSGLPDEPVNVIREDPENEDILYLGTDRTVYISLNRGLIWNSLRANLPTVPVYDMKIHPRDNILVIATHGRGIFKLPVANIRKLDRKVLKKELFLFDSDKTFRLRSTGGNQRGYKLHLEFYSGSGDDKIGFKLLDKKGKTVKRFTVKNVIKGINISDIKFDMKKEKLKKGEYIFKLKKRRTLVKGKLKI